MSIDLIFVSILEGLTEFLPISSTAHIILLSKLIDVELVDSYIKFYLLFIQLGALLAGISVFAKRLLRNRELLINVIISFIPSAIVGFLFYKLFKHLLEGNMILMSIMLFLGGAIFIYLEKYYIKKREVISENISRKNAFIVGLAQSLAIVPGVSRSGATIIAGIFSGIKKTTIFEYTFLLAIPTLGAAVLYDAYKSRDMLFGLHSYTELIIGFALSFIVAYITLKILNKYLYKLSLAFFGWYRIAISIFIAIYFYVL